MLSYSQNLCIVISPCLLFQTWQTPKEWWNDTIGCGNHDVEELLLFDAVFFGEDFHLTASGGGWFAFQYYEFRGCPISTLTLTLTITITLTRHQLLRNTLPLSPTQTLTHTHIHTHTHIQRHTHIITKVSSQKRRQTTTQSQWEKVKGM